MGSAPKLLSGDFAGDTYQSGTMDASMNFRPHRPAHEAESSRQEGSLDDSATVWLHIYDFNRFSCWANNSFLKKINMGVFHCGVEVCGREWCFLYYEDTWDDPTVTGVQWSTPKQLSGYMYRESVCMGNTSCSSDEVNDIIRSLKPAWSASSYHITERNCQSFAETLVWRLQVSTEFPVWTKNICEVSKRFRVISFIVNSIWGLCKRQMMSKHVKGRQRHTLRSGALSQQNDIWSMERHSSFVKSHFMIIAGLALLIVFGCVCLRRAYSNPGEFPPMAIVIDVGTVSTQNHLSQFVGGPGVAAAASCAAVGLQHCSRCDRIEGEWRCLMCAANSAESVVALESDGRRARTKLSFVQAKRTCKLCSELLRNDPVNLNIQSADACKACALVEKHGSLFYHCTNYTSETTCRQYGLLNCSTCSRNSNAGSALSCQSCAKGFQLQHGKCAPQGPRAVGTKTTELPIGSFRL